MKSNNRTLWIDVLKVIAMIFVILLHVMGNTINTLGLSGNPKTVYDILIALFNVSIPIFVMVSGYLLLDPKKEIDIQKALKKYVLKVLLILGIFGTFFILLEEFFNTRSLSLSMIKTVLVRLINGEVWAHMWYLYMLLGLYLLTPFIKILIKNISKENLGYLLLVLYFLTIFIPDVNHLLGYNINLYVFSMPYLFYFLLGYFLGMYEVTEKQKLIVYFLGLFSVVAVLINYYDNYNYINISYGTTYLIFLAMSLFLLVKNIKIKSKFNKIITFLAECSLGIYILHQFFINIIYKVLKFDLILDFPYIGLVGYGFVILLVTYGTVYLLRLIKPLKKIL